MDKFDKRVKRAQHSGMTRLEVSICHGALDRYNPLGTIKGAWENKIRAMFDDLIKHVLNSEDVKSRLYRKLSLPQTLGLLGRCQTNILAIGKFSSWLINTKTSHS